MSKFTIITPYLFEPEISLLKHHFADVALNTDDVEFLIQEDKARVGSDKMYEILWNKCNTDIFIMHADMMPSPTNKQWYDDIQPYIEKFPEAGMFGLKLIYPVEREGKRYIQSAGGRFVDNRPDHFGSGLNLFTNSQFKAGLEEDLGQYDHVREVAWTTFGGVYIRRQVIDDVGNFDPQYEWSYNRDVDYCLEARKKGWKIYQLPIAMLHFESKDNNRLRMSNPELNKKEARNLEVLQKKWGDTEYYKTVNQRIMDGR